MRERLQWKVLPNRFVTIIVIIIIIIIVVVVVVIVVVNIFPLLLLRLLPASFLRLAPSNLLKLFITLKVSNCFVSVQRFVPTIAVTEVRAQHQTLVFVNQVTVAPCVSSVST